jgi:hypothetical protein
LDASCSIPEIDSIDFANHEFELKIFTHKNESLLELSNTHTHVQLRKIEKLKIHATETTD